MSSDLRTGSLPASLGSGEEDRVLVYEKLRPGLVIVEELARLGFSADLPYGPDATLLRHARIDEDALIELARGYRGVLGVSAARYTRRVFEQLPDLRYISKIGIGFDVIDIDAANEFGVKVTNTPAPVEIDSVAEHTITLLLAAAKRLDFYSLPRMRAGGWVDLDLRPRMLKGRTLGLIGFGRIAREVARRLQPWGIDILAYDIVPVPDPGEVRIVELDELTAKSDFISLHVPGSPHARPLLDETLLQKTKPGVVIINTGRGEVVDQEALRHALETGRVSVAALDVFVPEPANPDDDLFRRPNLIPTPHIAATTDEAELGMELMAVTNLVEMMQGGEPASLVTRRTQRVGGHDV